MGLPGHESQGSSSNLSKEPDQSRCCTCYRYRSEQDHSAALQALHASQVTLKALPAPEGPYSQYDLNIIQEILHLAHDTVQQDYEAGKGSGVVNLVRVLQAYEAVLPLHGVAASEDVHYYRALLKLSLDPDADWWSKFAQLCLENQRYIC